jgi:2-polyprenyl-3-methyl-5-hydroxy-6-metoxy-1,4-benzoquinol methylase
MIKGLIEEINVELIKNQIPDNGTVFDIGFGVGIPSYQLYNHNNKLNFSGVDLKSEVDLEENAIGLIGDDKFLESLADKHGRLELYTIYEHVTRIYCNSNPINKTDFKKTFKFQFEHDWIQYIKSQKMRFDLIIMSNILHYKDFADTEYIFKHVHSALNDNGLIYITVPIDTHRNKIDPDKIKISFTRHFKCLIDTTINEHEEILTVIGQKI